MHSVADIYKSRLFLFRFPNVHSNLRNLSREVFSRRGSTVGPGSITMKPKISCYTYRSQNLVEACILNGCSNLKDAALSDHDSLKNNVPPRISAKSTLPHSFVNEIMSKKHAVEKNLKKS